MRVLISSLLHPSACLSKGTLCLLHCTTVCPQSWCLPFGKGEFQHHGVMAASLLKTWPPWPPWPPWPCPMSQQFLPTGVFAQALITVLKLTVLGCKPLLAAPKRPKMKGNKANKAPSTIFQYTHILCSCPGGLPLWSSSSRCKAFSQCATVAQASGQSPCRKNTRLKPDLQMLPQVERKQEGL